ncbi:MAG: helix-turn-helix transcriptional regulator [Oscillospiraceae bacterium]|nr:helix-turn-helix transcriptional regulator [Oscillospiraceae bacterium]
MNFNERLVSFRKARGLNQETLADQVGVSRQAVSKWETGEAQPDFAKLLALADALEVSLDELCGRVQTDMSPFTPVEQSTHKKTGTKIAIISLAVVTALLLLCLVGLLLFGRADTIQEETSSVVLTTPITVSGMEFSRQGNLVQYSFSMSVVDETCAYEVTFTNHDGTVETSKPQFTSGVFHGTVKISEYSTYRVNVTVTQGDQHRVVPVLIDLSFGPNGYSYNTVD